MNAKNPATDFVMSAAPSARAPHERTDIEPSCETNPFAVGSLLCQRYRVLDQLDSAGPTFNLHVRDERRQQDTYETDLTIKVVRPELRDQPQWTQRLRREFEQTRQLKHPNIVRMHSLENHAGHTFIAMELLKGRSLATELQNHKEPLPKKQVSEILASCCRALSFAHARGITHADLRPENIFLTSSGGVRLMGFGSIPAQGRHLPMTEKESEAAYTSPQIVGSQRPDTRDDVFSLACIVHELLCGQPMQREISGARVRCIADPCLPAAHREVLEKAFSWRREERPTDIGYLLKLIKPLEQSTGAAHDAVREPEIRSEQTALSPPSPPPSATTLASRRHAGVPPQSHAPGEPAAAKKAFPAAEPAAAPATSAAIDATSPSAAVRATVSKTTDAVQRSNEPPSASMPASAANVATFPALRGSSRSIPAQPPQADTTPAHSRSNVPARAGGASSSTMPRVGTDLTRPTDAEHSAALRRWTIASALIAIGAVFWAVVDANREKQQTAHPATVQEQGIAPAATDTDEAPAKDTAEPSAPAATAEPPAVTPVKTTTGKVAPAAKLQRIAFTAPAVTVSARASAAALTLLRSDGRDGRLRVGWRIKEGTAVAGRDFTGPSSGSIEFAHLQTMRSLYIPLQSHLGRSGVRKFTVELTAASDGVLIQPNHAVTVTIVDYG